MYKIGDRVLTPDNSIGIIDNIIDDKTIVKYPNGNKMKYLLSDLDKAPSVTITITPEKYDDIVKVVMYDVAEDSENKDHLNFILELIGAVASKIKERLFNAD